MYIHGKNAVKEIIKNKRKIKEAYIYRDFNDKKIIFDLEKLNTNIKYVSKKELDAIEKGNHQGIIIDIPDYNYCSLEDLILGINNNSLFVILDHLEDPHNFGAIIRTCEAAGVDGIIIPKDRSVHINSTVMKVSSGALDNVRICNVTNINETIRELKHRGVWIVGSDITDAFKYSELDYNYPLALIVGNEGQGMKRLTKELCDFVIKLPMKGKINSLNASVATGIMIYEILEKRER